MQAPVRLGARQHILTPKMPRADQNFPALEFRPVEVWGEYSRPLSVTSERKLAEVIRTLRSLAPQRERKPLGGDDPLGYSRFRRNVNPVL